MGALGSYTEDCKQGIASIAHATAERKTWALKACAGFIASAGAARQTDMELYAEGTGCPEGGPGHEEASAGGAVAHQAGAQPVSAPQQHKQKSLRTR